jgi:pimeloyl-ACP methyl ester carboxylesterase
MNRRTISLLAGTLPLTFADDGEGRPYLLLHGGAGPASMSGLANAIAKSGRAILPTYPGFDGQPRPDWFHRVSDLTTAFLALIESLDLHDVVVVGNSMGGWIAVELALCASPRISSIVLLDAIGIEPNEETGEIADPAKLGPEIVNYSFHDPKRFAIAPTSPEALAMRAANQKTLRVYTGEKFMYDPGLRSRLPEISLPTLVIWGNSDRISTPAYGKQFASLIPDAKFELLPEAGHFPHIEQLDKVMELLEKFVAA